MIVDLPDTTTNDLNKKITALREEGGAITLGRVLTLVVAPDSEDLVEDAIDAAVSASREHPCRIIVVVPADRMLGKPGDGWQLANDLLPFERSTCFWQRIAYLFTRMDRLLVDAPDSSDADIGAAYLALHTVRCKSAETQRRFADGARLGPETSIDKVLLAGAEQRLYDTAHDLLPGVLELGETPWRPEYLYSRAATIYGGTAEIQRNIIARRLLDLGKE